MSELTQSQVVAIQGLTANVDLTYRTLIKSRTALSFLIAHGQATCNDVKTYNAMMQSTYFYQKGIADIIRAQGGTAPAVQPPIYIAWAGKTGDAAIDINCDHAGLSGALPVMAKNGSATGDYYIDPKKVEWRQEQTPSDTANIAKFVSLAGSKAASPGLGNPLLVALIPLILWGIIITVAGVIILRIVEALTDVPGKQEYTRQVAISAERHAAVLEARQKCLQDCLAKGGSNQETCAKNCARLITEYKAPSPNEPLGIIGKVVLGVVAVGAVIGGVYVVKWATGRSGGGHGGGDHDDDGDDLDGPFGYATQDHNQGPLNDLDGDGHGFGDFIDAEFTERRKAHALTEG